ncbi:MAG TPA: hypothetical protein DDW76_04285 [Cyanobacteria bacterium UBA11369]|nr:hypothetical protein [Cyanobacteria bacterium UBA11371]HBE34625.1 hypothetical protein [Cyanobacteria bacterium UBA11368]HBE48028.1 hypothetical protein [Cyanobacteria bacterium UBA11369]
MTSKKLSLVAIAVIVTGLVVLGAGMGQSTPVGRLSQNQVMAQALRTQDLWRQVYQQMPDLPLENQYVNQQSGKVDPDNTLASRLIRYHMFVKGRPPNFRLDWKLTIADYLGENELIEEGVYPGGDTLRENPIAGDRAAIQRLTRSQRNALIQTLVNIFNPNAAQEAAPLRRETRQLTPAPNPTSVPTLPQPGDAQRLRL